MHGQKSTDPLTHALVSVGLLCRVRGCASDRPATYVVHDVLAVADQQGVEPRMRGRVLGHLEQVGNAAWVLAVQRRDPVRLKVAYPAGNALMAPVASDQRQVDRFGSVDNQGVWAAPQRFVPQGASCARGGRRTTSDTWSRKPLICSGR